MNRTGEQKQRKLRKLKRTAIAVVGAFLALRMGLDPDLHSLLDVLLEPVQYQGAKHPIIA